MGVRDEDVFMYKFNICKKYYEEYGDLLIPNNFEMEGVRIGKWIAALRWSRKLGGGISITSDRIALLDSIGMIWDTIDYHWANNYRLLKECYLETGKCSDYGIYKDVNLDNFAYRQRKLKKEGTLSLEKITLLDSIKFCWDRYDVWNVMYEGLVEFKKEYKTLSVPFEYFVSGKRLCRWCDHQKILYEEGKLTDEQIEKLLKINFPLVKRNRRPNFIFDEMYALALEYYKTNGNLLVKQNDGVLGQWIAQLRVLYNKGGLNREKIIKLNEIGMVWIAGRDSKSYTRSRKLLIDTLREIRNEISVDNKNVYKKERKNIIYK